MPENGSKKLKILVTGGAGFQGTHLVEKLHELGHEVTVLNTSTPVAVSNQQYIAGKAYMVWGSVTDFEVTEKVMRGKDVVFHLGGRISVDESILDPWSTLDANIKGTYNVLEAARKSGTRLIYTSTCEVYGRPENLPITEKTELKPHTPYASSKAAGDRLAYSYFLTYGLPVTIVRPFNLYGERQKEGKFGAVIPIFTAEAMRGEPIKIFGSGAQTRDYMHVSDIIRAYLFVLARPDLAGEVFNFGTGVMTSIKDIAEYIVEKFNTKVIFSDARPGDSTHIIADYSKAKKNFGWEPTVGIFDGLDRYIEWRKNKQ